VFTIGKGGSPRYCVGGGVQKGIRKDYISHVQPKRDCALPGRV